MRYINPRYLLTYLLLVVTSVHKQSETLSADKTIMEDDNEGAFNYSTESDGRLFFPAKWDLIILVKVEFEPQHILLSRVDSLYSVLKFCYLLFILHYCLH